MEILFLDYIVRENTWDWAAVDTLVKLTKGNVDAAQTPGKIRGTTAIDALVENATTNVDAILAWISNRKHSTYRTIFIIYLH